MPADPIHRRDPMTTEEFDLLERFDAEPASTVSFHLIRYAMAHGLDRGDAASRLYSLVPNLHRRLLKEANGSIEKAVFEAWYKSKHFFAAPADTPVFDLESSTFSLSEDGPIVDLARSARGPKPTGRLEDLRKLALAREAGDGWIHLGSGASRAHEAACRSLRAFFERRGYGAAFTNLFETGPRGIRLHEEPKILRPDCS